MHKTTVRRLKVEETGYKPQDSKDNLMMSS